MQRNSIEIVRNEKNKKSKERSEQKQTAKCSKILTCSIKTLDLLAADGILFLAMLASAIRVQNHGN